MMSERNGGCEVSVAVAGWGKAEQGKAVLHVCVTWLVAGKEGDETELLFLSFTVLPSAYPFFPVTV